MDLPPEELLVHTLSLLEWRLKRIEFVLNGGTPLSETPAVNVSTRLHKLEQSLQQLASKSDTVSELLKLQAHHPHLFTPNPPNPPQNQTPPELSLPQKTTLILAEASSFSTTSSQLRSLNDTPLPSSHSFATLVSLRPRIHQVRKVQYEQAMEISELRRRSGVAVLRWHEVFVLGAGRCWVDFEGRVRDGEGRVRRVERRVKEEEE
ncbi:hypothetical protein EJ08DRAFT_611820, partial [Tothia fuscella]